MDVGERIKKRRKELGLSADFVADKLNVSRSTIFRYEKGDIEKLPTSILEDISNILQTTPAFLMGWENEQKGIGIGHHQNVIGPAIKYVREFRKISILELSVATGYNQFTISGHENRTIPLDEIDIRKYAETLKVSPQIFFTIAEKLENGESITDDDVSGIISVNKDQGTKDDTHMVIAAHMDDNLSEEELQEVMDFINFVKSKRK
nr:helix-turn-helix transcriptional regulator [Bacillus cereus]